MLIISPHLPPSMEGCGDATDCLAREYLSRGDEVLVITDPASERTDPYRAIAVGERFNVGAARRAVAAAREFGADAAFMHYTPFLYTPRSLFPIALARGLRAAGIPVGIYAHECFYAGDSIAVRNGLKHRYLMLRDAITLRAPDVVFVPNEERRALVQMHAKPKRLVTLRVAANVEPRSAPERRTARAPFRLLTFGVVMPRRRIELLIAALAKLVEMGVNAHLTIAGRIWDEAYADACVRRSRELGVAQRVKLSGALESERLTTTFAEHDLFLHAAEEGSVSNAGSLLAALAHGIPVVAARTERDEAAFASAVTFTDPDAESIARTSAELLHQPGRLADIAHAARRFYENGFGWHRIADTVEGALLPRLAQVAV